MRLRLVVSVLAAVFVGSGTTSAEELRASIEKAALTPLAQESRELRGKNTLLWPSVAMMAAGGTLTVLGATVLKTKGDLYDVCYIVFRDDEFCSDAKSRNQGLMWVGAGIAGTGATLALVGQARRTDITFAPGGAVLRHRIRW